MLVNVIEFIGEDGADTIYEGTEVNSGQTVRFRMDRIDAYEINEALLYNEAPIVYVEKGRAVAE